MYFLLGPWIMHKWHDYILRKPTNVRTEQVVVTRLICKNKFSSYTKAEIEITILTCFKKIEDSRSGSMWLGYKRHSFLFTLFLLITLGNQLSCHEGTEATQCGSLHRNWALPPRSMWVSHLGSISFPQSSVQMTEVLDDILDWKLMRDPEPKTTQLSCSKIPDPQKLCEIIHNCSCCFKILHFV